MCDSDNRKAIRSYVRRQGRMTKAQQRALVEYSPRYVIAADDADDIPPPPPPDWAAVFNRSAPLVVEIGSGYGEATAAIAAAECERNYVAFEVHSPGVGALLNRLADNELTNVRVIQSDAVRVIPHFFAAASVSAFNIFFPDPWRKKRHHKRRLLSPSLLLLLRQKLIRGGGIHFVTDWQPYADYAAQVFAADHTLQPAAAPKRATTGYELRAAAAARAVHEFYFTYQP